MDNQIKASYNLKLSAQDYTVVSNLFTELPASYPDHILIFESSASAYHLLHEAQRAIQTATQSNCEGAEFMHPRLQMSIGC